MHNRKNFRCYDAVRLITFKKNPFGFSESSILYEQGLTKIFVTVGLQNGVPKFLKGSGKGWLTAEYVMHPYAGDKIRSNRDIAPNGRDYRSIEISRFIGRVFRSVVNLSALGERTIYLDCDVLQADGGTRTAAINAITIALLDAEKIWMANKQVYKSFFQQPVLAISCGVLEGKVLVDLDKDEDSSAEADFNFVMTKSGLLIEVQGTAEQHPIPWDDFDECRNLAQKTIANLAIQFGV